MNDDHIARLESEIRYLKGMLDENGISYDYEAFVEAAMREKSVEIEFPTLTPEHAIHFYSGLSSEGLYGTEDTNHPRTFEGDERGLFGCHWFISAVS